MRWWSSKAKSLLDADDEEWQIETWRWLISMMGGIEDLNQSPLVTPTRAFFPPTDARGHARAEHVFAVVKEHARLGEWTCRLIAQPERPQARVNEITALRPAGGHMPLGTFGVDGNEVVITYDSASLKDPAVLIATLAHELAHYLLATFPETPPGGKDNVEFATDLATVYLGFGLFGTNTAVQFQQHQDVGSQGWSLSRQGYLTEAEWCFALAVFLRLRGLGIDDAKPYLKDYLVGQLRQSLSYLDGKPDLIESLRNSASLSNSANPS